MAETMTAADDMTVTVTVTEQTAPHKIPVASVTSVPLAPLAPLDSEPTRIRAIGRWRSFSCRIA